MADLFKEIIPSILQTKESVIKDSLDEKSYNPYMVNRTLSYHVDCVFYANEMNMNYLLDGKMQYDFYLHSIRKMKRKFQKWHKNVDSDDLKLVKEHFGYSDEKAKDALRILSEEQLEQIRTRMDKGGITKLKK